MSEPTNFRAVLELRFSHAAALARAIYTLKSHAVFGGIEPNEATAFAIGQLFLDEILQGKCPLVPDVVTSIDKLQHGVDVTFVSHANACIEAFNTVLMGYATRTALHIHYTEQMKVTDGQAARQVFNINLEAQDLLPKPHTCGEHCNHG